MRLNRVARLAALTIAACLSIHASNPAHAGDAYPNKTVRIIMPFTAGGADDTASRVVAAGLGTLWHQAVVVEPHPGAGGVIGAELTAHSDADGYTLLMASGSMFTVNPLVYKHLNYSLKDFSLITTAIENPMVVAVAPQVPAKSLADLIAYAKSKPGTLNFGSAGYGSQVHMAGEGLANAAGIQMNHVPYKGEMLAYGDLIADRVQVVVGNLGAIAPFVKSGKARGLAVTSNQRSPALPDIPTATEAGLKGFNVTGWFGLVAPVGTPPDVIAKIHNDVVTVLNLPETKAKLAAIGETPVGDTPDQMKARITKETDLWKPIVAAQHISLN
jgi:tripartite-type tricarboxylate transporter receptor subunit TctC